MELHAYLNLLQSSIFHQSLSSTLPWLYSYFLHIPPYLYEYVIYNKDIILISFFKEHAYLIVTIFLFISQSLICRQLINLLRLAKFKIIMPHVQFVNKVLLQHLLDTLLQHFRQFKESFEFESLKNYKFELGAQFISKG
jgi:hypothetical protein